MLIQSFLADKGVGPDLLLQALLDLIDDDEMSSIGDMALKALRVGNFSIDELQKMLATSKASLISLSFPYYYPLGAANYFSWEGLLKGEGKRGRR